MILVSAWLFLLWIGVVASCESLPFTFFLIKFTVPLREHEIDWFLVSTPVPSGTHHINTTIVSSASLDTAIESACSTPVNGEAVVTVGTNIATAVASNGNVMVGNMTVATGVYQSCKHSNSGSNSIISAASNGGGHVGSYILSGLGSSASQPAVTSVQNTTFPTTQYANFSIAPTGSGFTYAYSCYVAANEWDSLAKAWNASHATSTLVLTSSTTYFSSVSHGPGRTYTLCDGWPRVDGPVFWMTVASSSTYNSTVVSVTEPYPYPSPTCSINSNDCQSLAGLQSKNYTLLPDGPPICTNGSGIGKYNSGDYCFVSRMLNKCVRYSDNI